MYRPSLLSAFLLLALVSACGDSDQGAAANQGATTQDATTRGATTQGAAPEVNKPGQRAGGGCDAVPGSERLKQLVSQAPKEIQAGGLSGGRFEWAAVVNRAGEICAVAVSTDDPTAAWPGSRAIAMAKAYTANAFSTDKMALSTARLYAMAQPGRSLYGAAAANPFDPRCLAPATVEGPGEDSPAVCGGTIVFGGGVPLYDGKTRVGGLGASGDTPCADHEIAKQIRDAAGLNPPKGKYADDIRYREVDGPGIYIHPLCPNTWRNGKKIGTAPPATLQPQG